MPTGTAGWISIVRQTRVYFQPIRALRGCSLFGHEALLRGPRGTPLEKPEALFEQARMTGTAYLLDTLCLRRAVRAYRSAAPRGGRLFLNVEPGTWRNMDDAALDWIQRAVEELGRGMLVFEVTERDPLIQTALCAARIRAVRRLGACIAIDDFGAGYSGLRALALVRPDYVKIDRSLIRGIHRRPVLRAIVRAVQDLAGEMGVLTVAEGVERQGELDALVELGVNAAQGYLLGQPAPLSSGAG